MLRFEQVSFNAEIDEMCKKITARIENLKPLEGKEIDQLAEKLEWHFHEKANKNLTPEEALDFAKEEASAKISRFMQSLVYKLFCENTDKNRIQNLLATLIESRYFFHINPAEESNKQIIGMLFDAVECAYRRVNTPGFQQFILRWDNNQHSLLDIAVRERNLELVKIILDAASRAFGGKYSKEFCQFISHLNQNAYFSLLMTHQENNEEIFQLLFDTADKAYNNNSLITEEYKAYIASLNKMRDNEGYSLFHLACRKGKNDVVRLLLDIKQKTSGGENTDEFRQFIFPGRGRRTPLYLACKAKGNGGLLGILLGAAERAYGGKDTDGFRQFISDVFPKIPSTNPHTIQLITTAAKVAGLRTTSHKHERSGESHHHSAHNHEDQHKKPKYSPPRDSFFERSNDRQNRKSTSLSSGKQVVRLSR